MTSTDRRRFLAALTVAGGAGLAGPALAEAGAGSAQENAMPELIRPPKLKPGDTLALVSPSNGSFLKQPYDVAIESLQALGLRVREAPHLRGHYGPYGGTDAERAGDLNAMFADPEIKGIIAMTG